VTSGELAETSASEEVEPLPAPPGIFSSEDWLAVWIGGGILLFSLLTLWLSQPRDFAQRARDLETQREQLRQSEMLTARVEASTPSQQELADQKKSLETAEKKLVSNPFKGLLAKMGSWADNPLDAFAKDGKNLVPGLIGILVVSLIVACVGVGLMGESLPRFVPAFLVVFLLALVAFLLTGQKTIKYYNFEYAIWAIGIGLVISNTIGTPDWLKPGVRTEFYIKTGLVLYGAEVLFHQLLALGLPGILTSWLVTPVTLIGTYLFGQYVLRIPSKSLNLVISADMSVCGVSAAIATAASCRAKKEELSLAVGISLVFTAIMMVVMPGIIRGMGLSPAVAGAWLGGTIDSTGAVGAAGAALGEQAELVALTVKMIQNILIGVVAFCVAIYWVGWVEPKASGVRPDATEIWRRFPKFVLGFVGASILFTAFATQALGGQAIAEAVIKTVSDPIRSWLFCLAFVSIGLETDFRQLAKYLTGGKALVLYVCGQTLNLSLSLLMAWIMFEKVFPHAADALSK
jgi:uncharacterized integral membrane protein (TIGR00698 family)